MAWAYEGVQCYVSPVARPLYRPVFRAWNERDHFYTASFEEYDGLPSQYRREGIAFYAADRDLGNFQQLFRLYRREGDDHFYTSSVSERDNAVSRLGYALEGVLGYVLPVATPGHVELYRAYNPQIEDHFYTIDVAEIDRNGPTLSWQALRDELNKQMAGYLSGAQMYFADDHYFCPTEGVAQDIINNARADQQRFISEVQERDDFAHLLKAAFIMDAYDSGRRSLPYGLGILWGAKPAHAMNVLITSDGAAYTVKLIEPQTGTIHALSANKLSEIYLAVV